jgi:hypothetical protein
MASMYRSRPPLAVSSLCGPVGPRIRRCRSGCPIGAAPRLLWPLYALSPRNPGPGGPRARPGHAPPHPVPARAARPDQGIGPGTPRARARRRSRTVTRVDRCIWTVQRGVVASWQPRSRARQGGTNGNADTTSRLEGRRCACRRGRGTDVRPDLRGGGRTGRYQRRAPKGQRVAGARGHGLMDPAGTRSRPSCSGTATPWSPCSCR